jgi:hypothetical protein
MKPYATLDPPLRACAFTGPDRGLTVNAVHVKVNTVGLARVDTILASSESDAHICP